MTQIYDYLDKSLKKPRQEQTGSELPVEKLPSGEIDGDQIFIGGFIKSKNHPNAGWRLNADGTAEFNDVITNDYYTTTQTAIPSGSPVMILKNGSIAVVAGNVASIQRASSDRMVGFSKSVIASGDPILVQRTGLYTKNTNITFESQKLYGTTGFGIYDTNWYAQTFVSQIALFSCTGVRIRLFRRGTGAGTITVSLRATSAGLPTGADLASGTFDSSTISTGTGGTIVEVNFSSAYTLTPQTTYAIVVHAAGGVGDASNLVAWYFQGSDVYTDGSKIVSTNSGSTWSADTTKDFWFEVIGNIPDFTPGAMYKISQSYSAETITIDQATEDSTVDGNLIVEQTFVAAETFISRISLSVIAGSAGAGTYAYTLKLYDSDGIEIASKSASVAVTAVAQFLIFDMQTSDGDRALLCPGRTYKLKWTSTVANQILLGYKNSDVYASGSMTVAGVNYPTQDLKFRIRERYGAGYLTTETTPGNYEYAGCVGIGVSTTQILIKSFPLWK